MQQGLLQARKTNGYVLLSFGIVYFSLAVLLFHVLAYDVLPLVVSAKVSFPPLGVLVCAIRIVFLLLPPFLFSLALLVLE